MASYDGEVHHYDDDTKLERTTLDSYPAGKNHEKILLCGPNNDTQWIMSDTHVDITEGR